ncbi:MAG: magnesium transporter, partial [Actinobacteria bacterium]|nr:magnesium transporter [Actinomycetota bacterium]
ERSRRLEDRGDEPRGIDSELYGLKQQLSRLRRYVLPGDQLLRAALAGDDALSVSKSERKLFRDVLDHLDRIGDQVHSIGDLVDAAIDLRRSAQTATLSEVNKKLTAWAAIIAVPTLISSTYGMNFSLVPEDQTLLGFWFALALMAVSATTLFVFFKRRGWL